MVVSHIQFIRYLVLTRLQSTREMMANLLLLDCAEVAFVSKRFQNQRHEHKLKIMKILRELENFSSSSLVEPKFKHITWLVYL